MTERVAAKIDQLEKDLTDAEDTMFELGVDKADAEREFGNACARYSYAEGRYLELYEKIELWREAAKDSADKEYRDGDLVLG